MNNIYIKINGQTFVFNQDELKKLNEIIINLPRCKEEWDSKLEQYNYTAAQGGYTIAVTTTTAWVPPPKDE